MLTIQNLNITEDHLTSNDEAFVMSQTSGGLLALTECSTHVWIVTVVQHMQKLLTTFTNRQVHDILPTRNYCIVLVTAGLVVENNEQIKKIAVLYVVHHHKLEGCCQTSLQTAINSPSYLGTT